MEFVQYGGKGLRWLGCEAVWEKAEKDDREVEGLEEKYFCYIEKWAGFLK